MFACDFRIIDFVEYYVEKDTFRDKAEIALVLGIKFYLEFCSFFIKCLLSMI